MSFFIQGLLLKTLKAQHESAIRHDDWTEQVSNCCNAHDDWTEHDVPPANLNAYKLLNSLIGMQTVCRDTGCNLCDRHLETLDLLWLPHRCSSPLMSASRDTARHRSGV
jgi:hypothetical protein